MRFQKIVKGETLYINDAYNASPISMRYSLETFDKLYNDICSYIKNYKKSRRMGSWT